MFAERFQERGRYLMDEPEAALSFSSCLRLVALMHELAESGGQIVCATHSPVLAGTPGADIIEVGEHGTQRTKWEDLTLVVALWRRYLADPTYYLRHIIPGTPTDPTPSGQTSFTGNGCATISSARRSNSGWISMGHRPSGGWTAPSVRRPRDGWQRWLRVVTEAPAWSRGDTWTGNVDANAIVRVIKPRVLDIYEWRDNPHRHVRAEVMTRMPGVHAHRQQRRHPILRSRSDGGVSSLTSSTTCGPPAPAESTPTRPTSTSGSRRLRRRRDRTHPALGNCAWRPPLNNLFSNPFGIIDWELWGTGPAGTDAATLYLYSLTAPAVGDAVHDHFAHVLDSADGRRAQLHVAARLLHRGTFGDHPELVTPLQQLVAGLTEKVD